MLKRDKIAMRVNASKLTSKEAEVFESEVTNEGGEVVDVNSSGYVVDPVFDDEPADNNEDESKSTRDHKRLKRWGKKNKKLRDKEPYGEKNGTIAYVALTTNRVSLGKTGGQKVVRHNPFTSYGSVVTGATVLPHHHRNNNSI